jgi:hypothetical protein
LVVIPAYSLPFDTSFTKFYLPISRSEEPDVRIIILDGTFNIIWNLDVMIVRICNCKVDINPLGKSYRSFCSHIKGSALKPNFGIISASDEERLCPLETMERT